MWLSWRVHHWFVVCLVACLIFFGPITTPNLLLLCYCQKLQVPSFIGCVSFLLLLLHFCFCLGCVGILAGPALICGVFCCSFNFFCPITTPNLLLLCYCQKLQVPSFIGWPSFVMPLDRVCFWLSCLHALCVSWFMFCVVISRLSIFFGMRVKTWCAGKFPGHPGPQIMHAYVPPCPSYLILSLLYTIAPIPIDTHPYTPTCTHIHTHI